MPKYSCITLSAPSLCMKALTWHANCFSFGRFFNKRFTQENLMAKTVADVMKLVKENEV